MFRFNSVEIDRVTFNNLDIDVVNFNNTQVYISTIYVPKPTAEIPTLTYNTSSQGITVANYNEEAMDMIGDISAINTGSYSVTYKLKKGYAWLDESTDDVTFNWSINKATLNVPTISGGGTFKNAAYTVTVNGFDSNTMTQGGTTSATNVGTYTVTWSLKDSVNYQWNTTASRSWSITVLKLTKPSLTNTSRPWTGSSVSPTINNYNSTYINQSGTASANSVGSWSITWSLKSTTNTQWADGTTGNVTGNWSTYAGSTTIYLRRQYASSDAATFTTTYNSILGSSNGTTMLYSSDRQWYLSGYIGVTDYVTATYGDINQGRVHTNSNLTSELKGSTKIPLNPRYYCR